MKNKQAEIESIELELLLEGVYRLHGYDFRNYARASLIRRIRNFMLPEDAPTLSALQEKALHDPECFARFLLALSVNVTAMFRDPAFFLALRNIVVPRLRAVPFIRIWCAGCSTGEEVYSLAILLEEEGLYERCRMYATDMNEVVLEKAMNGVFPLSAMQEYTANYLKACGKRSFSDYYTAGYGNAIFAPSLKRNMVFAQHNLVTDGSFNEFHVILCRNVLIYFNRSLQERVHKLLFESLAVAGVLGLGEKESVRFTPHEKDYERLDSAAKIYRRIARAI